MFKEKTIPTGKVFYSDLIPELEHFFTTRESFLKTEGSKQERELVLKNRRLTSEYLNIKEKNLIFPNQTHSSNISISEVGKSNYAETDALILTNKEQAIFLNFADCVPVIIYDKGSNIAAVSHAGWRGTVSQIVPKTIEKMTDYTARKDLKNFYIIIGPSISDCCYNIGEEVINGIKTSVNDSFQLFRYENKETFVNLKKTNAQQAIEHGIPKENIDICPFCTSCRNDLFYSYRKENGTTNRHNAVIKLV